MQGLTLGFGLGFVVALPVGPMSLHLIRSTLRSGLAVGLAIAAGITVVDTAYAAAGAAGAAAALTGSEALRRLLALLGSGVLVWLGVRAVRRLPADGDASGQDRPGRALVAAVAATSGNPATIASWAAIFTAASAATETSAVSLVAGVALGSGTWVVALACGVAAVRRQVGSRLLRVVDVLAGLGLVAFGVVLGSQAI